MSRRIASSSTPNLHAAPPREFQDESLAAWVARQARPTKPKQPRNFQKRPEVTASVSQAFIDAMKKAPGVAAPRAEIPHE